MIIASLKKILLLGFQLNRKLSYQGLIFSSTFILVCSCTGDSPKMKEVIAASEEKKARDKLTEENFYDYIEQFETTSFNESGNLKSYCFVSNFTKDTLVHINYDQNGNPKSVKKGKNQFIIAEQVFHDGTVILFTVQPPGFYNRIRVEYDLRDSNNIIDTISKTVKFNIIEHDSLEILISSIDTIMNASIDYAMEYRLNANFSEENSDSLFIFY